MIYLALTTERTRSNRRERKREKEREKVGSGAFELGISGIGGSSPDGRNINHFTHRTPQGTLPAGNASVGLLACGWKVGAG